MPGGHVPGGRGLDRRGFLGAAAGVVAAAGVATSPFAWAAASKSSADCADGGVDPESTARSDPLHVPEHGLELDGAVPRLHHADEDAQLQCVGVRGRLPDRRPRHHRATPRAGRLDRARQLRQDVRLPHRRHARRPVSDERREPGQRAHQDERVGLQPGRRRQRVPERRRQPARARAPRSRTRARSPPGRRARTR